jgi:hypothetical protein
MLVNFWLPTCSDRLKTGPFDQGPLNQGQHRVTYFLPLYDQKEEKKIKSFFGTHSLSVLLRFSGP